MMRQNMLNGVFFGYLMEIIRENGKIKCFACFTYPTLQPLLKAKSVPWFCVIGSGSAAILEIYKKKPGGQFQITYIQDGSSSERRLVHREKLQLELPSRLFHSTNINLHF